MLLHFLKHIYRSVYQTLTSLGRSFDKRSKAPKALILTYHRIDTLPNDPLMLAVPPERFEDQLRILKKYWDIISLPELLNRLEKKTLVGNELVITFDDGYTDNLTNALPIAQRHHVPITIFVTSGIFKDSFRFPWDDTYQNNPETYLSRTALASLASQENVTIGAHTMTHPRLRDLSQEAQKREIEGSKRELETLIGGPISYIAYPYGTRFDLDRRTPHLVHDAGYEAAFTMYERAATEKTSKFLLPRINVRDWTGEKLRLHLAQFV